MPPAIEICHIAKRFGAVTALDDVSISIEAGEMFFLLGPSGCGKTTLLRILAGLETSDSGDILFNGRDVASLPAHERGAPMVFQNYALWPHLNVHDNIAFGLVERKIPRREISARVQDVLKRVGLDGLGARKPGHLSGGQQQRVVLARALVLNPAIILLDEPLSNLDAKLRVEMRQEIEKLRENTDITFVYVTHDQADALSLADRMAVMQAGRVSAIGTPLGLYARPPNRFCADFLGESNLLAGRMECKAGSAECSVETSLGMWRVADAGKRPQHSEVLCLVRPENLQPVIDGGAGMNVFDAEVKGLRMNGATVTVCLSAAGVDLLATVLTQNSLGLKRRDRRRWGVAHENVVLMDPS
ncbi:MAG: ABC transporter ATP-binding protein [bacterium]